MGNVAFMNKHTYLKMNDWFANYNEVAERVGPSHSEPKTTSPNRVKYKLENTKKTEPT